MRASMGSASRPGAAAVSRIGYRRYAATRTYAGYDVVRPRPVKKNRLLLKKIQRRKTPASLRTRRLKTATARAQTGSLVALPAAASHWRRLGGAFAQGWSSTLPRHRGQIVTSPTRLDGATIGEKSEAQISQCRGDAAIALRRRTHASAQASTRRNTR